MIKRHVRAMVIVVMQPAIQLFAALSFRGIAAGVGPTVSQGSVKAFHLAVGLWAVREASWFSFRLLNAQRVGV